MFTLSSIPGFADLSDTPLTHDRPSLGLLLAKISSNAAFGMARLEVFNGVYINGDTVALPVSPIDGYPYSREELNYVWAPQNTGDPKTNWCSAGPPWTMWYVAYKVDQATGAVSCETGYRGNNDHKDRQMHTNDGVLTVWTIAQRQRSSLTLAASPYFTRHDPADLVTDAALTQQMLVDMNESAKFGVVNAEVIYLGEFKNGDTVPQPVSPADGYSYQYGEAMFVTAMRWTMDDDGGSPPNASSPAISEGQLKGWASSVAASTGLVTIGVTYDGPGVSSSPLAKGRVAVFAFCQRTQWTAALGPKVGPWDTSIAGNPSYSTGAPLAPLVCPLPLVAGQQIRVSAQGSVSVGPGWIAGGPNGVPYFQDSTYHDTFGATQPAFRIPGQTSTSIPLLGGVIGAFTDNTGLLIAAVAIGAGATLTVPAGATRLQIGINDSNYSDNTGGFTVVATRVPQLPAVADSFSEIDDGVFFPGEVLKASTMLQLEKNIEDAYASPEFFGPTSYADAATVALPVSAIDGYSYTRDECQYIWTYADTTVSESDNARLVCLATAIDPTSGAVSIRIWRASSSSDGAFLAHNGTLRVVTIAKRNAILEHAAIAPVVPTTGGGISSDEPTGGEITVNGA